MKKKFNNGFPNDRGLKRVKCPLINRVKVQIYFYGLTIEIDNFAFEVKVILGLKRPFPDSKGAKIGLNGFHDIQGYGLKIFLWSKH